VPVPPSATPTAPPSAAIQRAASVDSLADAQLKAALK
jgi:hypothetical protein